MTKSQMIRRFIFKRHQKRPLVMEEELNQYVLRSLIQHGIRIVRYLLKEYHDEFFKFPAAKSNHHAYAGGLAFHHIDLTLG